jgi:hypothetical protein
LSYAHLHAVTAQAEFACEKTGRLTENADVDAVARILEHLADNSKLTDFKMEVQLKATAQMLTFKDGRFL